MNVGRIQNRGIEFVSSKDNLFASNLDLVGSLTYVDSAILENTGFGQFTSTIGKKAPYVPRLRASLVATYRAGKFLALSLGGRFSGKQYSTVDNTDTNPNTYGGFDTGLTKSAFQIIKIGRRFRSDIGIHSTR